VSESEGEDETADKVVELSRSPLAVMSPAQNGDTTDDVFLFDNNIPSIATRIPSTAEPSDTLELRRRNRLLRLISDPWLYSHTLQRSVSVQLDDRRRPHHHSDDISGTSWHNGELSAAHLPRRLTPPKSLDDDDDDDEAADAEAARQRQDGLAQIHQPRGRAALNRCWLTNGSGGVRRKVVSVDACCTDSSEATSMKRRGTLRDGKVVVADDLTTDDDNAELSCHLCNGLDDQLTNNPTSVSEHSTKAN